MDQLNEVVKYILYRCRENNTPITEIMANFVAQTIYNPRTFLLIQALKSFTSKISFQNQRCGSWKKQQSNESSPKIHSKWRSSPCKSVNSFLPRLRYRVFGNRTQETNWNPKLGYCFRRTYRWGHQSRSQKR
jgi:hypothetical protein